MSAPATVVENGVECPQLVKVCVFHNEVMFGGMCDLQLTTQYNSYKLFT